MKFKNNKFKSIVLEQGVNGSGNQVFIVSTTKTSQQDPRRTIGHMEYFSTEKEALDWIKYALDAKAV